MTETTQGTAVRRIDEGWDGTIDRIPEKAMPKLAEFIRGMASGFELKSMQGHTNSVTCTISFDGVVGPEAQLEALERMFQAHGLIETLFINLRHERGGDEGYEAEATR